MNRGVNCRSDIKRIIAKRPSINEPCCDHPSISPPSDPTDVHAVHPRQRTFFSERIFAVCTITVHLFLCQVYVSQTKRWNSMIISGIYFLPNSNLSTIFVSRGSVRIFASRILANSGFKTQIPGLDVDKHTF